jgi:C-terminal processing protease CtpA/Prc
MMRLVVAALALVLAANTPADARSRARPHAPSPATPSHWDVTADQRVEDLNWLADKLKAKYAYRDKKNIDFDQIKTNYRDAAEKAVTPAAWLNVVERVMAELYDHHATVGQNTASSPQLVPSGADIWAELVSGKPMIVEVRAGSVAARAGLKPGMTIESINGRPVDKVIDDGVPQSMAMPDPEAGAYALRVALAGTHVSRRSVSACTAHGCKTYAMGPVSDDGVIALVSWRKLDNGIGYIRIENSLGQKGAVRQFDAALEQMSDAKGFILDLRDTPSGGDTDVAEPMLGRFIDTPTSYQRVFELGSGRRFPQDSWAKDVDPREPVVKQPLVVLVDHWTGSMGEGLAIGFDAAKRATIVGTKMAGLLGGTSDFTLPHTHVPISFPTERLYHVNGTPRENFKPEIWFDPTDPLGPDALLKAGIDALKAKMSAR